MRNPGASDVVRQAGVNVPTMAKLLRDNLPNIISKRWELGTSEAVLAAQLEDIVKAMEHSAQKQQLRSIPQGLSGSQGLAPERGLGEQLLYPRELFRMAMSSRPQCSPRHRLADQAVRTVYIDVQTV